MNSQDIYHKCGEIFFANQKSYYFLCCYCNELFHEFPEFQTHSLLHVGATDSLNGADIIQTQNKLKKKCDFNDDSVKDEDNQDFSDHCERLELNNKLNINCNEKEIFTATESKENIKNEISEEINCPHCKISYVSNSHDVQKCLNIQDTIKKFDGDFIKLLREGILCCSFCKQYFEDYKRLYEHHIDTEHCFQKFQCKICKFYAFMDAKIKINKSKVAKDDRLKIESKEIKSQTKCESCNIYFDTKSEYNSHLNLVHEKNEINEYGHDSDYISSLDSTVLQSLGELPFKCTFCERLFRKKSQMKTHMRIHTNHRPYKCELCSSAFTVAANLKNHIVYKHTDDKPFVCEYEGCNAKFKLYNLKKQHEKRHLPANFQCEICGNYYKTKFCLLKHQQSRHEDAQNWPHQCEICCKRFARSHHLVEHKRIHTGEKPFGCDLCSKFFRKRSALREHKKLHSDERKYICRFCGKGFKQAAGYWGHMKRHPPLS
ncbi:zinc finger protein 501-like [Condylostylus longicornis]|uniref:zinc finger protein 501-like n=1 Tax=Condylostylus longicornis TaxID=2530218 RepID=UPI00244DDD78|nr:zinc finger protein 501-like [Condylostylus longicornis]